MLSANALEVSRHLGEGFVPSDPFPAAGGAAHGMFETIFVVVNILEGDSLWADVATAERIVFVAADVQALLACNCDLDATDRLAEIAVAIMNRVIHDVQAVVNFAVKLIGTLASAFDKGQFSLAPCAYC